jgi:hypothetical protein
MACDCAVDCEKRNTVNCCSRKRIIVLDAHDARYECVWSIVAANKAAYCAERKYELRVERFGAFSDRSAHWGRVKAIQKHLKDCDWLFYLDTDVLFTNFSFGVESYVSEHCDCVVGRMPTAGHVSTSGILLRNCAWSFELLDRWWADPVLMWFSESGTTCGGGKFYDQSGFHKLLDTCPEFVKRVRVLPRGDKNWNNEAGSWKHGDWLLHVPGEGAPETVAGKLRLLGEAVKNLSWITK